ncbi:MAG: polyribonucleotide nucleotidyltransferase [Candidatus Magasanikbacteria bacterium]|nr:polyribonucleotide nucleotidyltransferase [Candidatus Magasanikbacteria bacterium]
MLVNPKSWSIEWGGRELTIETGKLALQAGAACTVRYGDTMILATATRSSGVREGLDFFPLSVEFQEKLYAAGKIKGSRFIKREGRPSDDAVLSGRIIDRAIRPLFDDSTRNEVQVVTMALSVDGENDAFVTAFIAASCALAISPIPWNGPIGAARIGRVDGELVLNVKKSELENSDLDLIVAGTPEKLIMVESGSKEVKEQDMFDAMKWGCEQLNPIVELIKKIQTELGTEKVEVGTKVEELEDIKKQVKKASRDFVFSVADSMIFDSKKITKKERKQTMTDVKNALQSHLEEKGFNEDAQKIGLGDTKKHISDVISNRILEKDERLDGRGLEEVRELFVDGDTIPRVHGSAIFMRGDTQVLSIVTLGSPGDVQTMDTMEEDGTKRYMHHYNDMPYTYGETGRIFGPGRRAIGHGALAERALMPMLPTVEEFPYTMRVVSEVMGSNGSSSMASTCASTLSLMISGVPIKKPVAGIAIGLASDLENDENRWKVLTDLQDVEDGKGGMDFKITGTIDGITAMQMDTKTQGLNWDIVDQTLKQSADARTKILAKMSELISEPRPELASTAPRIETIEIDPDKIRDVIGPGGKMINKIIADTGVQMDIEQDGRVIITSSDQEGMDKATEMVLNITKEVEAGEIYEGTVARLENFGAFVNILPGKDGLVHVSEIAWARIGEPSDVLKIGDKVQVKVKEIDNMKRINLSIKALLPKPEGFVEQSRPPRRDDKRQPKRYEKTGS